MYVVYMYGSMSPLICAISPLSPAVTNTHSSQVRTEVKKKKKSNYYILPWWFVPENENFLQSYCLGVYKKA